MGSVYRMESDKARSAVDRLAPLIPLGPLWADMPPGRTESGLRASEMSKQGDRVGSGLQALRSAHSAWSQDGASATARNGRPALHRPGAKNSKGTAPADASAVPRWRSISNHQSHESYKPVGGPQAGDRPWGILPPGVNAIRSPRSSSSTDKLAKRRAVCAAEGRHGMRSVGT